MTKQAKLGKILLTLNAHNFINRELISLALIKHLGTVGDERNKNRKAISRHIDLDGAIFYIITESDRSKTVIYLNHEVNI